MYVVLSAKAVLPHHWWLWPRHCSYLVGWKSWLHLQICLFRLHLESLRHLKFLSHGNHVTRNSTRLYTDLISIRKYILRVTIQNKHMEGENYQHLFNHLPHWTFPHENLSLPSFSGLHQWEHKHEKMAIIVVCKDVNLFECMSTKAIADLLWWPLWIS